MDRKRSSLLHLSQNVYLSVDIPKTRIIYDYACSSFKTRNFYHQSRLTNSRERSISDDFQGILNCTVY